MKVTNHRQAEVHLPLPPKGEAGAFKSLTLHPGVNDIDDDVWEKVKDHRMTKAFLADEHLEVGGKPAKESIPTLKDYVESGYEPSTFKKRFPNAKVDEKELIAAQLAWDQAKEAERKAKKGGRETSVGSNDPEAEAQKELEKLAKGHK